MASRPSGWTKLQAEPAWAACLALSWVLLLSSLNTSKIWPTSPHFTYVSRSHVLWVSTMVGKLTSRAGRSKSSILQRKSNEWKSSCFTLVSPSGVNSTPSVLSLATFVRIFGPRGGSPRSAGLLAFGRRCGRPSAAAARRRRLRGVCGGGRRSSPRAEAARSAGSGGAASAVFRGRARVFQNVSSTNNLCRRQDSPRPQLGLGVLASVLPTLALLRRAPAVPEGFLRTLWTGRSLGLAQHIV